MSVVRPGLPAFLYGHHTPSHTFEGLLFPYTPNSLDPTTLDDRDLVFDADASFHPRVSPPKPRRPLPFSRILEYRLLNLPPPVLAKVIRVSPFRTSSPPSFFTGIRVSPPGPIWVRLSSWLEYRLLTLPSLLFSATDSIITFQSPHCSFPRSSTHTAS